MYLTKRKALESTIYRDIHNSAYLSLVETGCFSKEEILERTGYAAVEGAIRWDMISDMIRDTNILPILSSPDRELNKQEMEFCKKYPKVPNAELIPVVKRYFMKRPGFDKNANPSKFVAVGHGKKTYGYAFVHHEGTRPLAEYYINKEVTRLEKGAVTTINKAISFSNHNVPLPNNRQIQLPTPPHFGNEVLPPPEKKESVSAIEETIMALLKKVS